MKDSKGVMVTSQHKICLRWEHCLLNTSFTHSGKPMMTFAVFIMTQENTDSGRMLPPSG